MKSGDFAGSAGVPAGESCGRDARAPSASPFGEFIRGAGDPFRGGAFLLGRPGLWPLAMLPFLLTLLLYVTLLWGGHHFLSGWVEGWLAEREGWFWSALEVAISVLYWLVLSVVLALIFVPVATVIASPFNDLLSEKVEFRYKGVRVDEPFSLRSIWRGIRVGVIGDLYRAVKLALLLLLAFCLNIIPVIGNAAAVAASAFLTIMYLTLEFTSYSMDRRYYTWDRKKRFLRRHRARTLGFGTASFFLMLVPIVNAAFIPISAVGGTLLFCDTGLGEEPA
jgi:CysZ protein